MIIIKTLNTYLFLALSLLPTSIIAQELAQDDSTLPSISLLQHLQKSEIVDIVLTTDFDKLRADKAKRAYQPAQFSIYQEKEEVLSMDMQVRARGKFRARSCKTPPMKIKFKKKVLRANGFNKLNELKLVIPCAYDLEFEQYIAKEFLIYKLYNLLTPNSLQVQLINLKFRQEGKKKPGLERLAFIIEDREELLARIGSTAFPDSLRLLPKDFEPSAYTLFQTFQFMIGNTDWIVPVRHNLEVIQNENGDIIPVPFDFDFSGFVSSHYAIPNSKTDLKNVQNRFFMGNDKTEEEMHECLKIFIEKKSDILKQITDFQWITKSEKKKLTKYIESFYEIAENLELVKSSFIDKPDFFKPQY